MELRTTLRAFLVLHCFTGLVLSENINASPNYSDKTKAINYRRQQFVGPFALRPGRSYVTQPEDTPGVHAINKRQRWPPRLGRDQTGEKESFQPIDLKLWFPKSVESYSKEGQNNKRHDLRQIWPYRVGRSRITNDIPEEDSSTDEDKSPNETVRDEVQTMWRPAGRREA